MASDKHTKSAQHTPGPWVLELCRVVPTAPIYGFAITAAGKTPFVASAGVSTPNHVLIVSPEYRSLVTTGFTEEEVEANARLIAAAPDLLAALRRIVDIRNGEHEAGAIGKATDMYAVALTALAKAEGPIHSPGAGAK